MPTMPLPWARICFDDADDGVGCGVHVGADGVEADEIDFDPRGSGGRAQGLDGVAGDTVGADDALLFGFGEDVHDAAVARGPVAFGDAVNENDVDVVGAELAAEAIEVGADSGGVAGVGLGERR